MGKTKYVKLVEVKVLEQRVEQLQRNLDACKKLADDWRVLAVDYRGLSGKWRDRCLKAEKLNEDMDPGNAYIENGVLKEEIRMLRSEGH